MIKVANIETKTIDDAKKLIKRVLSTSIDNPNIPISISFFQSDTYRFYFLMSFMWEFFEANEISQEYAISLVPKKFASRIKRLQVLKQAVQLGFIDEASSTVDKRRRIYTPSNLLTEDFIAFTETANKGHKDIS
ncbi:hypothetical protein N9731_05135 [Gammaproteobacteria bacterium]|jgi:hypothetical protein|nr:hypothetical protein [Gammaproteobacteria bacterium]|tara:strand:- start:64 stop:465 length:402 start_codon:yes stop_codon:yes gene_type:complete